MIKLRSTPFLKAMGFRYQSDTGLYIKGLNYRARVFRRSDELRALDIWKDLYKGNGEFAGSTSVVKNFPLDGDEESIQFYWDMFTRLSVEFEAPHLLDRFLYHLGYEEEDIDCTELMEYQGFFCNLPKVFWQIDPFCWRAV